MNPIKKLFIEKHLNSVQSAAGGTEKHTNYEAGYDNDDYLENREVPSLQMRYMIDDYDELFGTSGNNV